MFSPGNALLGGYVPYPEECIEQLKWSPSRLKLLQYLETGKSQENQNIFVFYPPIHHPGSIPSGTCIPDVSLGLIYPQIMFHAPPTSIHVSRSSIISQNAKK